MKKKRQQVCIKDHNIIHTSKKTGNRAQTWKDMKERKKKCHREEELRESE